MKIILQSDEPRNRTGFMLSSNSFCFDSFSFHGAGFQLEYTESHWSMEEAHSKDWVWYVDWW